jgi:hypothetical protein
MADFSPLPESFMFGVATADHQCEAYDQRYEDIRDVWERRRNLTPRDRALLDIVDMTVRQFKESGAWADSYGRYFPGQIPEPPTINTLTLSDIISLSPALPLSPLLNRIHQRGYLIVAVKDNVPGFGYCYPNTGEFSGLEIDLAKALAQQIFGDASKVQFRAVKSSERLQLVRSLVRIFDPIQKIFSILSTSVTSNWWHLGMAGKLPSFLCPEECVGQQDFVGFDYYWGINNLRINRIRKLMDAAFGRFGNAPVWSGVLYDMLKFHAKMFPGKEILIVENGCVEQADNIKREEYIRQHIREVQRAHYEGVNVVGYISWSMTSNREWGLKFDKNSDFGLYHKDLKRKPTAASLAYRQIIEQRSV